MKRSSEELDMSEESYFQGNVPNNIVLYMTRFLDGETIKYYCRMSRQVNNLCKVHGITVIKKLIDQLNKQPNTILLVNVNQKRYKFIKVFPKMDEIVYPIDKKYDTSVWNYYDYVFFSSLHDPVFGGKIEKDPQDGRNFYTIVDGRRIELMRQQPVKMIKLNLNAGRNARLLHDMAERFASEQYLSSDQLKILHKAIDHIIGLGYDYLNTFSPYDRLFYSNFNDVYKYYNLNFKTM